VSVMQISGRVALHHDVAPRPVETGSAIMPAGKRDSEMSENTAVQINVDTFSDGHGYFVRIEIEARSVTIHGPFSDQQAAQKLKSEQISYRSKAVEAIKLNFREMASSLPGRERGGS
jgi:hypothetical protein